MPAPAVASRLRSPNSPKRSRPRPRATRPRAAISNTTQQCRRGRIHQIREHERRRHRRSHRLASILSPRRQESRIRPPSSAFLRGPGIRSSATGWARCLPQAIAGPIHAKTAKEVPMPIRFECRRSGCDGVMGLMDAPDANESSVRMMDATVAHGICPKCGTLHAYESTTGFVSLLEGHEGEDILSSVGRARFRSAP
jgi:hypothetical protein